MAVDREEHTQGGEERFLRRRFGALCRLSFHRGRWHLVWFNSGIFVGQGRPTYPVYDRIKGPGMRLVLFGGASCEGESAFCNHARGSSQRIQTIRLLLLPCSLGAEQRTTNMKQNSARGKSVTSSIEDLSTKIGQPGLCVQRVGFDKKRCRSGSDLPESFYEEPKGMLSLCTSTYVKDTIDAFCTPDALSLQYNQQGRRASVLDNRPVYVQALAKCSFDGERQHALSTQCYVCTL